MTTVEVIRTTRHLRLTDAPLVEGVTSGLKTKTVQPVTATIRDDRVGYLASVTGPAMTAKGTLTEVYYTVNVHTSHPMYPTPPEWLARIIGEVMG